MSADTWAAILAAILAAVSLLHVVAAVEITKLRDRIERLERER